MESPINDMTVSRFLTRTKFHWGAALLVTLLVVSVLAATAFGVGKLVLQNISIGGSFSDGLVAHQAARAAVEEGLLRWKKNNNLETTANQLGGTDQDKKSLRVVLPTLDSTALPSEREISNFTTTRPNPQDRIYDLRIWFHADPVGTGCVFGQGVKDFKGDTGEVPVLKQQETKRFDISNFQGRMMQLTLCWSHALNDEFDGTPDGNIDSTLDPQNIEPIVTTKMFTQNGNEIYTGTSVADQRSSTVGVPAEARSMTLYVEIKNNNGSGTLFTDKNPRIVFAAVADDTKNNITIPMDTGTHYIEGTGYFGSAKQRLRAKIDRTTGKLIGVFDASVFKGKDPQ